MKILKFGGSSLATPDRVRDVARIIAAESREMSVAVVVSAFGGVTDDLAEAARRAATGDETYASLLEKIGDRHRQAVHEVTEAGERPDVEARVVEGLRDLRDLLHGCYLVREASRRTLDSVLSYGERLSALLVAAALRRRGLKAADCDARRLVVTDDRFGNARVDLERTYERIRRHFGLFPPTVRPSPVPAGPRVAWPPARAQAALALAVDEEPEPVAAPAEATPVTALQVVTGFLGASPDGETTTLGRGGSDYTASLLGAALQARTVELWTDVDGVMSADPRLVPDAGPIGKLSYDELMELSHFGAKVVYPPSVHPTRSQAIPLCIRNTFRPAGPGTLVTAFPDRADSCPVRGIASIRRVALLRLEGDGMVGVPGIAMRLFGALAREGVSVILISQASSEHSICFAVAPDDVKTAARSIESEFELEMEVGLVDSLVIEENLSVVAAVGAGMRHRSGIAGRLFGVLGSHGINVRAISQGSSELNISLVVDGADEARAVNAIHDAFLFPRRRRVELCVVGVGRVGATLLRQIAAHRSSLAASDDLRFCVSAVAGSRTMLADRDGFDPSTAVDEMRREGSPFDLERLARFMTEGSRPLRIFVDCTASDDVPALYERLLEAGVAVVTANKRRLAGSLNDWNRLMAAGPGGLYFETTVGAGLPVIGTIRYLLSTGDRVRRVEGVLSGTLGYLTDQLAAGEPFSRALRQAHENGYTEPDPREDLSGRDVARKLLILGRLAGHALEPADVEVEPFVAGEMWSELLLDDFWERLGELDETLAERQAAADRDGRRLVYLATLGEDGARVGLEALPADHVCACGRGTDNLIAVHTDRYRDAPLVVRGPGAGPEVTAAGVFGDLLRAVAEADPGR